ncbi:BTB/POZ domain-containing protein FBL11 isoform X2 [Solanum dulcamara]|uniref:BTB/POZ domain-containing protein FBL11 isoform X2 n=1 Tax=Solanum dulcamara TaxID=45834 RepID=UPI0024855532|nr:BTB/POZ domain-containing protein FBL11 isoform X2 [Solanum dulcamara]
MLQFHPQCFPESWRWNRQKKYGIFSKKNNKEMSESKAALFFGVDKLLLVCRSWLDYVTSEVRIWPPQLCLEDLVHIWDYGRENAIDFIPQLTGYLARNFIWMASCDSFHNVPFELLLSCVKHPCLTVDSEKHLCDAILLWLATNTNPSDLLSSTGDAHLEILTEIRTSLLSLPFAAGKRRCPFFSKFAERSVVAICSLATSHSFSLADILGGGDCNQLRIHLTEYTKILDLSGCPQINLALLLLNMLPSSNNLDKLLMKKLNQLSLKLERHMDISRIPWEIFPVLTFEAVQVVDVSNCPMLHLEAAIECFSKSFPSLTTLKAAYILNFRTMKLYQLLQRCPLLSDIDLTVDSTPVIPAKVSVISSFPTVTLQISTSSNDETCPDVPAFHFSRQLSNITKLILEGRTDIYDSDLQNIAECCPSLHCVNLNACTSITDSGISILVLKCVELHSIFACDTSFGQNCVQSLCRNISRFDSVAMKMADHTNSLAYKLQILHIGCCKGINETFLLELISQTHRIRSLCLRGTQLVDNSLYKFSGSSLEMLDVSDTKVSCHAVGHVVRRNPLLKGLIARGCRHLLQEENDILENSPVLSYICPVLYYELGKSCNLEEISLGWGFSFFSMEALRPAIKMLRTFTVGLGGSLGEDGLKLVPAFCPLLETLILYFQVVSDSVVRNILETLKHLQVLALFYCFGEISSLSFQSSAPRLRKLKLERVSSQMTNDDLLTLTRNCMNLTDLSLVGCRRLNSESQDTISNGWPGLISLHLEDCGEVTAKGVTSLMNCQALEDLLLRHNGLGIDRNFIIRAASRMPLLRKVAVDVCDAKDGDFDLPDFPDRNFLRIVKLARCNLKRRTLGSTKSGTCTTPVHVETLILTWDSRKLSRTVVKERL